MLRSWSSFPLGLWFPIILLLSPCPPPPRYSGPLPLPGVTSDFASSYPFLAADSPGGFSPPILGCAPLHDCLVARVFPCSTSPPLPPAALFRRWRLHTAELEVNPNLPARQRTSLLPAQSRSARRAPGAASPVIRAELRAVCCVPALESQIKGMRPRPEPGGRRWAPGLSRLRQHAACRLALCKLRLQEGVTP